MIETVSRRGFLVLASLALAGCATSRTMPGLPAAATYDVDPMYRQIYGDLPSERYPLPAIDPALIRPELLRQVVPYPTSERAGTIVVDPGAKYLYLVRGDGQAMRYGVGVGRAGYDYNGEAYIGRKAQWPRWTPTATMVAEDPEKNGPWVNGMEPGLSNPLGARALYLFNGGRDTLYRIHGTNDPKSIGLSLSSGCVRLFNHDIIDLYERVTVGSKVIVLRTGLPALGEFANM